MNALLLIDVQNDFVPGGALAVPEGDAIIGHINELQSKFSLVVASQDWHPAGHRSFASAHPGHAAFTEIDWQGRPQMLWPDHCVQGTSGAALHASLNTNRVEAIFRKGTEPDIDSYSAFFDNGHRKATGLGAYLRGRSVTRVYVAGLAADYCVYFTAKDALAEGFEAVVLEDATRAISAAGWQAAKKDLLDLGALVQTSHAGLREP